MSQWTLPLWKHPRDALGRFTTFDKSDPSYVALRSFIPGGSAVDTAVFSKRLRSIDASFSGEFFTGPIYNKHGRGAWEAEYGAQLPGWAVSHRGKNIPFESVHNPDRDVNVRYVLEWDMDHDDERIGEGFAEAVNEILQEAADYAKANHGGWNNRTGNAERSIQVYKPATPEDVEGDFGFGVSYGMFLEKRYHTIENAYKVIVYGDRIAQAAASYLVRSGYFRHVRT